MTDEELFGQVDTTAICDADKTIRVMDGGIRLRSANARIFGPAYTVRCRGDFLGVLRAIEAAQPGDVIVVDGGGQEIALGGELFARGALSRRLGGIVVDGGYRDIGYVEQCACRSSAGPSPRWPAPPAASANCRPPSAAGESPSTPATWSSPTSRA